MSLYAENTSEKYFGIKSKITPVTVINLKFKVKSGLEAALYYLLIINPLLHGCINYFSIT